MDQPLGAAVGNALEIREAVATIAARAPATSPSSCSTRVRTSWRSRTWASTSRKGRRRAETAIADGSALELYDRWIRAQGGDPSIEALPAAPVVRTVTAPRAGTVTRLGAIRVGIAALELGAGRRTKDDVIDHAVGVVCRQARARRRRGSGARRGARPDEASAERAADTVLDAYELGDEPPREHAIILRRHRHLEASALSAMARLAGCPSCPRSRPSEPASLPCSRDGGFDRVEILDHRLVMPEEPLAVAAELEGERVAEVGRRGKYLIVRFESGRALLIHLRMTGSLLHCRNGALPDDPYRRAVVKLDDGSDVTYRDVRRFGTWRLLEPHEVEPYLAKRLGKEPLERFTARDLAARLDGRRVAVKAALLDQRTVAGLGNIYADEALWYARVHPAPAGRQPHDDEIRRVHRGVRRALAAGIERQGSTLRDYRLPDGSSGSMQDEFRVYGREDEPCERCGTLIAKTRVGGRGTSYCPLCQRA